MTQADVAKRLACKERLVRELWTRRELPGVKVGRFVRFRPEDVEAYEASHYVTAKRGPLASGAS
jgi:excisionase family DNA binding protein